MNTNRPGVSVCLFSYNYEPYIRQAIDSVLMQKADFGIEIVVGDDCSTDRTREIILEYNHKYPAIIKLSFNEENIGGTRNWINTINACTGKYIALLDGDDYFTDPLKLQKQYDALEQHPEYVLCLHGVEEKYEEGRGTDKIVIFEEDEFTIADFLRKGWFVRTGTTFFKNGIIPIDPPDWVFDYPYRYDTILHVFLCMHGKALNQKEVMSVWRRHAMGMSNQFSENRIADTKKVMGLARQLNSYTGYCYTKDVNAYLAELNSILFILLLKSKKWWNYRGDLLRSFVNMSFARTGTMLKEKIYAGKAS